MSCQRFEETLVLKEAGALPLWQSWALDQHLRRCPACRQRSLELARTVNAYAVAIHPERRRPQAPRLQPVLPAFIIAVAMLGLLGAAAYVLLSPRSQPQAATPCRPGLPSDTCR